MTDMLLREWPAERLRSRDRAADEFYELLAPVAWALLERGEDEVGFREVRDSFTATLVAIGRDPLQPRSRPASTCG